jgi:hypothetical protein
VAAKLLGLNPRRIEQIEAATMSGSKLTLFITFTPLLSFSSKRTALILKGKICLNGNNQGGQVLA